MALFCRIVDAKHVFKVCLQRRMPVSSSVPAFWYFNLFSNVDDELMIDQHFPTCLTHA